jgi:hypothetical protein
LERKFLLLQNILIPCNNFMPTRVPKTQDGENLKIPEVVQLNILVVLVRKEVKKEDIAIRNQAGNPIFD